MKLFDYLDTKFQVMSVELQSNFTILKDSEMKAMYKILEWYRSALKYLLIPKVLVEWLLVCIGLRKAPISPLKAAPVPTPTPNVEDSMAPPPIA